MSKQLRKCQTAFLFAVLTLGWFGINSVDANLDVPSPTAPRLVAVGDLHGDLHNTLLVLQAAGLISVANPELKAEGKEYPSVQWTGKDSILLQIGDIMDRGPDTWAILDLFHDLKTLAEEEGGQVIMLYGNHEIMNLSGDFSQVNPQETSGASATDRLKWLENDGSRFASYLRHERKAIHVEYDTIFVHAGLTPLWASLGVEEINKRVQVAVRDGAWKEPVLGLTGPLWTRQIAFEAHSGRCEVLRIVLEKLELKRMVVGHTPEESGEVGEYCEGRLFIIDTAISRWMRDEATAGVRRRFLRALQLQPKQESQVDPLENGAPSIPSDAGTDLPPEYLGLDTNKSKELTDLDDVIRQTANDDLIVHELGIPAELLLDSEPEENAGSTEEPESIDALLKKSKTALDQLHQLLAEFNQLKNDRLGIFSKEFDDSDDNSSDGPGQIDSAPDTAQEL